MFDCVVQRCLSHRELQQLTLRQKHFGSVDIWPEKCLKSQEQGQSMEHQDVFSLNGIHLLLVCKVNEWTFSVRFYSSKYSTGTKDGVKQNRGIEYIYYDWFTSKKITHAIYFQLLKWTLLKCVHILYTILKESKGLWILYINILYICNILLAIFTYSWIQSFTQKYLLRSFMFWGPRFLSN